MLLLRLILLPLIRKASDDVKYELLKESLANIPSHSYRMTCVSRVHWGDIV